MNSVVCQIARLGLALCLTACEQTLRLPFRDAAPELDAIIDVGGDVSVNDVASDAATDAMPVDAASESGVDLSPAFVTNIDTLLPWNVPTFPCASATLPTWSSALELPTEGLSVRMGLSMRESPLLMLSDQRSMQGPRTLYDLVLLRFDREPPIVVRRERGNARIGQLRVDATERVHFTYATPSGLFYGIFARDSAETVQLLDANGTDSDFVLDDAGRAHVVYSYRVAGSAGDLRYRPVNAAGAPEGSVFVVDSRGNVGRSPSVVQMTDGTLSVSYHDELNGDLLLASIAPRVPEVRSRQILDRDTTTICPAGRSGIASHIVAAPDGRLVVAYTSQCSGVTSDPDLLFLLTETVDGNWTRRLLARSGVGELNFFTPSLVVVADTAYILAGRSYARASIAQVEALADGGIEPQMQRGSPSMMRSASGAIHIGWNDASTLHYQRCARIE